jgi:hypothetical protein
MISLCAVLVSTPQARSLDHRLRAVPRVVAAQREQALVDGGERDLGAGHRLAALRDLDAHDRRLPDRVLRLVGVTLTCSSCAAMPTLSAATPSLNAGLARSTIAVGAW